MTRGKSIANYLFILLLVLLSSRQQVPSPASLSYTRSQKPGAYANTTRVKDQAPVSIHSTGKFKIRVRYMGGECGYDVPRIYTHTSSVKFIDRLNEGSYVSFVASIPHFLFKLRGPPAVC